MMKRRIGWFDLPTVRRSLIGSDGSKIFVNKLDPLAGLKKIKVCVEYRQKDNGTIYNMLPENHLILDKLEPVYKEFNGWQSLDDEDCKIYRKFIIDQIKECGCQVIGFGTGPLCDDIQFV
jgi:adenylosuccinate synthase